ncbi:hypothetical protein KUH03_18615 [Sphingobacterium sp. E70]|nr:hypothetical protein [Sphingobacterium sp. E70]ULT28396.1 hypothetical protein KUH03_18615 [Sphingobacterium sp. E70]
MTTAAESAAIFEVSLLPSFTERFAMTWSLVAKEDLFNWIAIGNNVLGAL